jgi:hypothetical protein
MCMRERYDTRRPASGERAPTAQQIPFCCAIRALESRNETPLPRARDKDSRPSAAAYPLQFPRPARLGAPT